jgi:hypothetical protein
MEGAERQVPQRESAGEILAADIDGMMPTIEHRT